MPATRSRCPTRSTCSARARSSRSCADAWRSRRARPWRSTTSSGCCAASDRYVGALLYRRRLPFAPPPPLPGGDRSWSQALARRVGNSFASVVRRLTPILRPLDRCGVSSRVSEGCRGSQAPAWTLQQKRRRAQAKSPCSGFASTPLGRASSSVVRQKVAHALRHQERP